MSIHEFGKENEKIIVLIHPSLVKWDYFEYAIPLLRDKYHLVIPALPGYDPETAEEFISVEKTSREIGRWLRIKGYNDIHLVYGCSMGGSCALRLAADQMVHISHVVMDGGITPYQLPRAVTRLIAVRDFAMMAAGKAGGIKLLEKAFSTDELNREDAAYIADVFRHTTYRTLWNTFDSCNNYSMPENHNSSFPKLHYWYAAKERKARDWDIRWMKEHFPDTVFREYTDGGHGGLAVYQPERFAEMIERTAKV